jgi:3-oxoacyl-[acyl-carrier protein] reductase
VADAVLFFASNRAAYLTGSSLLVDGGSSMAPMPDLEKTLGGI